MNTPEQPANLVLRFQHQDYNKPTNSSEKRFDACKTPGPYI